MIPLSEHQRNRLDTAIAVAEANISSFAKEQGEKMPNFEFFSELAYLRGRRDGLQEAKRMLT